MRLNFTGRRKIEKSKVRVTLRDDPPGSGRGHWFELALNLDGHPLPADARVFAEAYRGLTFMRFDHGTVGAPATPAPVDRRLTDFGPVLDGVRFRVKVTEPTGDEAGKLLAEADNLRPDDGSGGGVTPLIYVAGDPDLAATPWRLELVRNQSDLPTLHINTRIGGKALAADAVGKPLLLTAAAREVFAALVDAGDHEDDAEHWATLWRQFAIQVLEVGDPLDVEGEDDDAVRDWVEQAVHAFAAEHDLAGGLATHMANLELLALEEEVGP